MPFKSEKQRRFLWAEHPEIAKRWAKEYPESNKGLPMRVNKDTTSDSKEKAAQFNVLGLISSYVNIRTDVNSPIRQSILDETVKHSEDQLIKVKIPHSDQPTYAGQEREHGEIHGEHPAMADAKGDNAHIEQKDPKNAINSLLQKISVVLSQSMAQLAENRKAEQEARHPQYQPKNQGIKQYSAPTPVVPPPMGSPQAQAQPAQPQSQQGVGMNSPSANPIQSFGPLSATGNINGNAAFGQKNSPDSLKTALDKWAGAGGARAIARTAEENGLSPEAAMAVGLLGVGGMYGAYYGGKKLLTPVVRRMNLRTLPDDEVGHFSLPLQDGNKEYRFAERYREPGVLGSLFMNDDATNASDALLAAAKKRPGMGTRLENSSWTPQDLDYVGQSMVKQYPDRYRPVKTAAGNASLARIIGMDYSGLPDPEELDYEERMKTALEMPILSNLMSKDPSATAAALYALPPAIGALAGGAYGAYSAPKGKKLKRGLIGAGVGGGLGLAGSVVGDSLLLPASDLGSRLTGANEKVHNARNTLDDARDHNYAIEMTRPKHPKETFNINADFATRQKQWARDEAARAHWNAEYDAWRAAPHDWKDTTYMEREYRDAEQAQGRDAALSALTGYFGGAGLTAGAGAGALALHSRNKKKKEQEKDMKTAALAFGRNVGLKWASEDKEDTKTEKKKKPSAGAAMYIAGLQGNDARQRAQKQVTERAKKEAPDGLHSTLSGVNQTALNLRGRTIAHQAVTPSTRILSDALGGTDSPYGMLINALGSIGGGPEVQDKVRKMYSDSDIDTYRDQPVAGVKPTKNESLFHKQWQGDFADKDYAIAAHRWNRENHPIQYFLNPFDRTGPMQELGDRLHRRTIAGIGEPEGTGDRVFRAAVPFAAPFMGGQAAQDKMRAAATRSGLYGDLPAAPPMQLAKAAVAFGNKMASLIAAEHIAPLAGAGVGAGIGALTSKKNRLRNALIGAGVGGLTGGVAEHNLAGLGLGMKYKLQDTFMPDSEQTSFFSPTTAREKDRDAEIAGLLLRNALKNPGGTLNSALEGKSPLPGLELFPK